MQLFRPEAIRGRDGLHGETLIVRPVSWLALAAFLATSLAAAIFYLSLVQHRPHGIASGELVAGEAGSEAVLDAPHFPAAGPGDRLSLVAEPAGGPPRAVEGRIIEIQAAPDGRGATLRAAISPAHGLRAGTPVTAALDGRPTSLAGWISRRLSVEAEP